MKSIDVLLTCPMSNCLQASFQMIHPFSNSHQNLKSILAVVVGVVSNAEFYQDVILPASGLQQVNMQLGLICIFGPN